MFAAKYGFRPVVNLLLASSADANACDSEEGDALVEAAAAGHHDVIRALLDNGATGELRGRSSRFSIHTALAVAMAGGHMDATKLLMERLDWTEDSVQHGMELAAGGGHKEVLELALDWYPYLINVRGMGDRTLIGLAAAVGQAPVVQLLVNRRADIEASNVSGLGPLMWASHKGENHAARALLEAQADVNKRCNSGRTALQFALRGGHSEMVDLLKRYGARDTIRL